MVTDSFVKADSVLAKYDNITCSISGGSDSDILLDLITKIDAEKKVKYVFFDTGIEFQATKKHLEYLEKRYGIIIHRINAYEPVPLACKRHGLPFISKQVSEFIQRLSKHNFQWEDKSFDELCREYPKCISALRWWCNKNTYININRNKYLKEFLIENPPKINISNKCCEYAKKKTGHKCNSDLDIIGVRKAEGGARSTKNSCFSNSNGTAKYRPLFWYKEEDKAIYEEFYGIEHSECYTVYGLPRTGCAGCPFGKDYKNELAILDKYEPKLGKAVRNIFKESYEYTEQYHEYRQKKEQEEEQIEGQMNIFDFIGADK